VPLVAAVAEPEPKAVGPVIPTYPSTVVVVAGPMYNNASYGMIPVVVVTVISKVNAPRSSVPLPVATTLVPSCTTVTIYPACALEIAPSAPPSSAAPIATLLIVFMNIPLPFPMSRRTISEMIVQLNPHMLSASFLSVRNLDFSIGERQFL
jgi:hypothetical protein